MFQTVPNLAMFKSIFFNLLFILLITRQVQGQEVDSLKRPEIYPAQVELHRALPKNPLDVVFLGNSITFWANWPELLTDFKYIKNRGIPGDNSFGVLDRLEDILLGKPKQIFLMIGINDLAQGMSEELLLRNISRICTQSKQYSPNTVLILQSILPTNKSFNRLMNHYQPPARIKRINAAIKELAAIHQYAYLDIYSSFVDGDQQLLASYTFDGVHLTLLGYEKWLELLRAKGYFSK